METKDLYSFGPFQVDARRRSLMRSGEFVPLPPKAFDVLYALLRRPGQTVSKDELMKEVWPNTFVEEGNLTQMVFLLRKALGDSDSDGAQPFLVTVPRQGYRFVARFAEDVAQLESNGEGQLPPAKGHEVQRGVFPPALVAYVSTLRVSRKVLAVALAMAIGSGLAGWLKGRYSMREPSRAPVAVRFTISPPDNGSYRAGKISPDGRVLALVAVDANGKGQLWARRLDSVLAQPLTAAEYWPFWSPDSRFIAFVDAGKLKRIPANGGVAQTICDAALVVGGSWSRNGTILFSNGEALFVVSASGGVARPLTTLNIPRQETTHDFPIFLPDGTHFLYTIHSLRKENGGIYVGSIGSPNQRVRLLEDISNTEYIPGLATAPGYLLFVRAGVLMARRFAATDLLLKGEAFPVIDHVDQEPSNLSASFSGSENGTLLVTAPYGGDQVTWFDRTGKRLGTLGVPGLHLNPQLSPDERTVALDVTDPERFSSDIWLFPVSPGAPSRLTFNGSSRAVWSPMGERVVFGSSAAALYAKLPAGGETESLLLSAMGGSDDLRIPCEWSRDARFLIFSERNSKTGYDLWRLPLFGSVKPIRLLGGEYNEWCGTLSPDSKWIAYASDESGRSEIYVQAFSDEEPHSQRKWQLSDNGGYWPKWRRDGKEVLYLDPDRQVVAVAVKTGYGFEHGAAQRLFASGIRTVDARFDVTKNGQRFLIPTMATATHLQPARVVINWTAEIPR